MSLGRKRIMTNNEITFQTSNICIASGRRNRAQLRILLAYEELLSRIIGFLKSAISFDMTGKASVLLSLSKFPILSLLIWCIIDGLWVWAAALVTISMVVDVLDGVVFNYSRFAESRELRDSRRLLDAASDRLLIGMTVVVMYAVGALDGFLVSAFLVREFVLSTIVAVPFVKSREVVSPNLLSKGASVSIGLIVISVCFGMQSAASIIFPLFLILATSGCVRHYRDVI